MSDSHSADQSVHESDVYTLRVQATRYRKALEQIARIAPTPEAKYAKRDPGYACALDLGNIAREALDHD